MPRRLLLAIAALVSGQPEAHAYLDPNVGGRLYQLLFPLLIALAGAWAVLRHKFSSGPLALRFPGVFCRST